MTGAIHERRWRVGCTVVAGAALLAAALPASASEPVYRSRYVGEEKREIKALSPGDVKDLREGSGWGLAKAAELNGLPGPKHVLEMKGELGLTAEQVKKTEELFREMNAGARELGEKLIALERGMDEGFAAGTMDEKELKRLLGEIGETYAALRFTHLAAHLKTPDILTEEQMAKYVELRGYSSGDPCANVPEGHDPVMWRRHNDCE